MRKVMELMALGLTLGAGLVLFRTTSEARPVEVGLALPFPDLLGGCVDCSTCVAGGEVGHKAYDGDGSSVHARGAGSHSWCSGSGTCLEQHPVAYPNCDGEVSELEEMLADLEAVRVAIVSGDQDRAIDIVERQRHDRLAYIPDRNAIQAIGCNGTIVAHLPLD